VNRFVRGAALALALIGIGATRASFGQTDDTVIHAAGSLTDSTTPLLYADKAGLFTRAGLKVEVERFTTGASIATAVSGGTLQIGQFNMFGLVLAHGKGLPFSLIAPGSEYRSDSPDGGLLVLSTSPLHTAKDFNGKTIGALSLQDLSTFAMESWMDANGGDSKTLRFVEVPQPLVMPALEQGRVDAASASQPIFGEALGTGRFRVGAYTQSAIAPRWQATAWYARADWIDQHRALAQKFVAVMHEANLYVNAHPAETLPLIAAYLGVEPEKLAKIHRAAEAEYLDPRSIQPVIDVAAKYKALAAPFPAQELINAVALKPPR
jgi:NitT/TauT family transport system substrate-binding protein